MKSNRLKDSFLQRRAALKTCHQSALVSRKWRCYEISVQTNGEVRGSRSPIFDCLFFKFFLGFAETGLVIGLIRFSLDFLLDRYFMFRLRTSEKKRSWFNGTTNGKLLAIKIYNSFNYLLSLAITFEISIK